MVRLVILFFALKETLPEEFAEYKALGSFLILDDNIGNTKRKEKTGMTKRQAVLMIAASERDANLYYATHFIAPDPFVFIQISGRKFLLMSDLEVDRARKESCVNEVLSTSRLAADYRKLSA